MMYEEISGSPKESLSESGGSTVVRQFVCEPAVRLLVAESFVGTAYPNFPQCRVNSVSIQPYSEEFAPSEAAIPDPSIATADYTGKKALVTVNYGPDFTKKTWPSDMPKPTIRTGTELRFRVSGSAQFLILPFGGCKWYDNDEPLTDQDNSRILIPIREIELQWDFVDDPPLDDLDALMGRTNASTFLGSEAETILFENYSVEETFRASPSNPHTNRVTVQLRKRRIREGASVYGWNHDYREDPAGWAKVIFASDGNPRYPTTSFAGMFA